MSTYFSIRYTFISFLLVLSTGCDFASDSGSSGRGTTYYIDSQTGNDSSNGQSSERAWKSLAKVGSVQLGPGDKLLLRRGGVFKGQLQLRGGGDSSAPAVVGAYGAGNAPLIDARGYLAAVEIENGTNFEIGDLELTADAGDPQEETARTQRYGVRIIADEPGIYSGFTLRNLHIHHIFATENIEKDGQNPTSNMGMGIGIMLLHKDASISKVRIKGCTLEMTGHTGIRIFGYGDQTDIAYIDSVSIINNKLQHIGGPGMVPGRCRNVLVRGNVVDHSGSSIDPRMHARGSGIWPWTSENVLIEKNKFMHARGKADSCGAHIDFNCRNVVVQYNLSMDNEGGFVEILGNDHNCCYRYNISINDGFRVKGEDGAHQEGKVLWTSGYTGRDSKRTGPFNSYIYNNTVYVKPGSRSCFSFTPTTDGILIANNIFYILGETVNVSGDQDTRVVEADAEISRVVFSNNLYAKANTIPSSLSLQDSAPLVADPGFANAGGLSPEDYVPSNADVVANAGIEVTKIPGDEKGLWPGLQVEEDFFGNRIQGRPDLGAVEIE